MRTVLYLLMILATVWLFWPTIELTQTEMGFAPGDPNPNIHSMVLTLGEPLPWIVVSHSQRESPELEEWNLKTGSTLAVLLHAAAVGVPAWVLFQINRRRS